MGIKATRAYTVDTALTTTFRIVSVRFGVSWPLKEVREHAEPPAGSAWHRGEDPETTDGARPFGGGAPGAGLALVGHRARAGAGRQVQHGGASW